MYNSLVYLEKFQNFMSVGHAVEIFIIYRLIDTKQTENQTFRLDEIVKLPRAIDIMRQGCYKGRTKYLCRVGSIYYFIEHFRADYYRCVSIAKRYLGVLTTLSEFFFSKFFGFFSPIIPIHMHL